MYIYTFICIYICIYMYIYTHICIYSKFILTSIFGCHCAHCAPASCVAISTSQKSSVYLIHYGTIVNHHKAHF